MDLARRFPSCLERRRRHSPSDWMGRRGGKHTENMNVTQRRRRGPERDGSWGGAEPRGRNLTAATRANRGRLPQPSFRKSLDPATPGSTRSEAAALTGWSTPSSWLRKQLIPKQEATPAAGRPEPGFYARVTRAQFALLRVGRRAKK